MMKQIINKYFKYLVDELGFNQESIETDKQGYFEVIYRSRSMRMRIEKYRKELYLQVSSISDLKKWIDLFMLIEYIHMLNKDDKNIVKSNYYKNIVDLDQCYREQIVYLSKIFKQYYPLILAFFQGKKYKSNIKNIDKYAKQKYGN